MTPLDRLRAAIAPLLALLADYRSKGIELTDDDNIPVPVSVLKQIERAANE